MITLTEIAKYYPDNEKIFRRNILKEYLQYVILEIIFNSKIGDKLSFLGGTMLRIVYKNARFSEDLDFNNFNLKKEEFEKLIEEIKNKLELRGYKVEIKNVFKGAYRAYIKLPGILFDNKMSPMAEEKVIIQIDTVPHFFDYKRDLKIINKFDIFTQIYTTPIDIVLSQKIYAALNRERTKGRDFFDILFLLPLTKPNYDYLEKKLKVKDWKELKNTLLSKTQELDFNFLAKDVEPFLVNPDDSKRVKNFVEYIKSLEL
ncbi:MAG: nucleotidyl transferase AbiEii/AbiGii toxin family protein [Candidatus Pacebacteria bacterium]|nr:nucleotidyl transferase AbiEii/AbiGii toxin family protein [Candidatus Paceibacterota bacterium]MDD5620981.1 nucleotidyl transferase AbiEii/AbiGii toxin family protein [Candidatus Paceibacterota bacterium]